MKNIKYILLLTIAISTQLSIAQENDISEANTDLVTGSTTATQDQEEETKTEWKANFDATVVSRFIWRGIILGEYPSIQSSVTFSNGGFFAGAWASYSLSSAENGGAASGEVAVAENYKEIIPYIGYGFKTGEESKLSLMVLTHYNPNVGGFFDFDNVPVEGGNAVNNRIEFRTMYNIGKLDFFGGWDFYNDPSGNSSLYLEAGYTFDFQKGISVRPFISGTPNDNYYTTDGKADLTQVGWYTSKSFSIGEDVGLSLKADMVYNPDRDQFNAAIGATVKL
ncbi:dihydroxyacetone kinase subunit DhaK [unidentified eubacterium SCB49]|nr:dihydroxyacetone kinase subunit DhaK [unidentified eubacterium SCB49]